jgi:hypothetical protein
MSGSHLSDAAVHAGPARQRAIATWLPCAAPRPCIKCAVGTTRRRPDIAAPFRLRRRRCPNCLASPRLTPSRLRRRRCPKPCHRRVRILSLSGRPPPSRVSSTVSVARAFLSLFLFRGALSSPSPPSSPSQDRRRPP